jgi:hypothetical protein
VLVIRPELEAAFRAHCDARWKPVPIAFAHQTLGQVPPGVTVPPDRLKPWGTAHAVLAAAPRGRRVRREQRRRLLRIERIRGAGGPSGGGATTRTPCGYRLDETLSEHGESRAACATSTATASRGSPKSSTSGGMKRTCAVARLMDACASCGDALVSMNLWGFRPTVFGFLEEAFRAFVARPGAATGEFC